MLTKKQPGVNINIDHNQIVGNASYNKNWNTKQKLLMCQLIIQSFHQEKEKANRFYKILPLLIPFTNETLH